MGLTWQDAWALVLLLVANSWLESYVRTKLKMDDNYGKRIEPLGIQHDFDSEGRRRNNNAYSQQKNPTFYDNLKRYFSEYCGCTAIHGIQFVGERKRYLIENLVWTVIVIITFCLCFTLVWKTYTKWIQSPVLISFSTTETPIWQVPFPAVTICPEVKSNRSRCDYERLYIRKMFGMLDDELSQKEFDYISLVCENPKNILYMNTSSMKITGDDALDFLASVVPDFKQTVSGCSWLSKEYKCEKIFTKIFTAEGVCYTFNLLDRTDLFTDIVHNYQDFWSATSPSDWHVDDGYLRETDLDVYPRRMIHARASAGLEILLELDETDIDIYCGESIMGFKVILHNPGELPNVEQQYFRISVNTTVDITFLTDMMTTASELKHYDPEERECFFENERSLKYFKYYNQQNCMVECIANNSLKECGCVDFHLPRDDSTPICGAGNQICMMAAEERHVKAEIRAEMDYIAKQKKEGRKKINEKRTMSCNCLPSCTFLQYNGRASQIAWDFTKKIQKITVSAVADKISQGQNITVPEDEDDDDESDTYDKYRFAKIIIFPGQSQFVTSERQELYGTVDFWSNVGGLLGLFAGFSFISILEIIHFLTLRLWCNIRRYGRYYWSGAEDLVEQRVLQE